MTAASPNPRLSRSCWVAPLRDANAMGAISNMKTTPAPQMAPPPSRPGQRRGKPKASHPPPDSPPAKTGRAGRRILLVDDDPTVRDSLKELLDGEGYLVTPAENGKQALQLADRLPIDLALLDLNMPVLNGWDTFRQMIFKHPLLPVIIVTARPGQMFTAAGVGAGALLEKPLDIPTLLRTIKELLREPVANRLARLAGHETDFYYQCARSHPAP